MTFVGAFAGLGLGAEFVGGLQSPVGFATFLGVAGLTLGAFTARSGAAIAAGLGSRRAD